MKKFHPTVHGLARGISIHTYIFLNWYSGGEVQMAPLGTAATTRPIVPVPGDYNDGKIGGMIGRGNRSTRRKNLPQCRFVHHKPHMLPVRKPGPPRWEASC
jgi:hypothetical protein